MINFNFVYLLWMYLKIIGFVDCCTVSDFGYVENAFLSCPTNDSCEAQCYRGYIFPTGKTYTNYTCQEGLSETVSSCKSIPVVFIEYMATWKFYNAPPKECDNIFILLRDSEEILGNMTKLCDALDVCVNISFAYRTQTIQINITLSGEHYNYTSTADLDACMSLQLDYVKNQSSPLISLIFDNITCWNETANHTLLHDWQESDRQRHCPPGTELKNVTVTQSNEGNIEYYCDEPSTTTDSISETTVVNLTSVYFNSTKESIEFTFERRTLYYVIASVVGTLLLLTLITIIVVSCKTKSFKTLKEQVQGNEMTELEMSFGTPFKGILIENEFYQSADDPAIVSKDDVPIVSNDTGDYSTALPYSKVEISDLESEDKNYSYATPLNQVNNTVSNDVIDEETNMQANRKRFSNAKFTENPPIVESSRVVFKKESKEEQNSLEAALSVLDEWIEENKVTRDSCQYTLVDKTFKTA
uniref:Uncharacterized protein LOC111099590 n=1 Tax=Crassostrea virginica TaxID=6565 RepID=A0A8B8A575_CRAVI|nr:uncharacterized protein LOC111099590 [Crassostrea virginica]